MPLLPWIDLRISIRVISRVPCTFYPSAVTSRTGSTTRTIGARRTSSPPSICANGCSCTAETLACGRAAAAPQFRVMAASATEPDAADSEGETALSQWGEFQGRIEDNRLVTGQGLYVADIAQARMAHAVVVRAQVASARILVDRYRCGARLARRARGLYGQGPGRRRAVGFPMRRGA